MLGCAWVVKNGCPGACKNGCLGGRNGRALAAPGWLKWRTPTGPCGWRLGLTSLSLGNMGCCPCWLKAGPGWLKGSGFWLGTGWVLLRRGGGGGGGGLRCSNKWWLGNLGSVKNKKITKLNPTVDQPAHHSHPPTPAQVQRHKAFQLAEDKRDVFVYFCEPMSPQVPGWEKGIHWFRRDHLALKSKTYCPSWSAAHSPPLPPPSQPTWCRQYRNEHLQAQQWLPIQEGRAFQPEIPLFLNWKHIKKWADSSLPVKHILGISSSAHCNGTEKDFSAFTDCTHEPRLCVVTV